MNDVFLQFVVSMGFAIGIGALLIASRLCIDYRLTATHLVVHWLGLPLRKIALENIKSIAAKNTFCAENWSNVMFGKGRRIVLRLHAGLIKSFVITPHHPFVFRTQLERLRQACLQSQKSPVKTGDTEEYLSPAFPPDFTSPLSV